MTRNILAAVCAGVASVALAAAQTPTTQGQPQQTPPAQGQPQQTPPSQGQSQQRPQSQQAQGQSVSLTGCVYQASDQPTVFALQRTSDASAGQGGQQGAAQGQARSQAGAQGQSGAATAGTSGSGNAEGAWYRLTPEASQDLKQYAGQAVRVSGTLVPGKDEKGADIIIHRIQPQKTVVTAVDLKPAPQLRIQSISAMPGAQCPAQPDNK